MRRFIGFTVVLGVLLLPTTAFGANFFVSGSSATEKKGFKPTISASKMQPGGDSLSIGFTKTSGSTAANTRTTQSQTWNFQLTSLPGAAHSISFSANLGSGHVRAGGKMGSYGSTNLTWTDTGRLKVRHPCSQQTVRSRTGRLDGTMRLRAGGGWQTVTVSRYQATVTKVTGSCFVPLPANCAPYKSLRASSFGDWILDGQVRRQGPRTTAIFFASKSDTRAFMSKVLSQLVPNGQFTSDVPASGTATAHVGIPANRAISGQVDFSGSVFTMDDRGCERSSAGSSEVTGSGLTARFFGIPALKIPTDSDSNWSMDRMVGKA